MSQALILLETEDERALWRATYAKNLSSDEADAAVRAYRRRLPAESASVNDPVELTAADMPAGYTLHMDQYGVWVARGPNKEEVWTGSTEVCIAAARDHARKSEPASPSQIPDADRKARADLAELRLGVEASFRSAAVEADPDAEHWPLDRLLLWAKRRVKTVKRAGDLKQNRIDSAEAELAALRERVDDALRAAAIDHEPGESEQRTSHIISWNGALDYVREALESKG